MKAEKERKKDKRNKREREKLPDVRHKCIKKRNLDSIHNIKLLSDWIPTNYMFLITAAYGLKYSFLSRSFLE